MFKGLWFFCKFGWKTDKRYIIYNVLYQFVISMIPLVTITMPKFIIDTLLGSRDVGKLVLYVSILTGYNLIAASLSHWLRMSTFTLRCKVAAGFGQFMREKLADSVSGLRRNSLEDRISGCRSRLLTNGRSASMRRSDSVRQQK